MTAAGGVGRMAPHAAGYAPQSPHQLAQLPACLHNIIVSMRRLRVDSSFQSGEEFFNEAHSLRSRDRDRQKVVHERLHRGWRTLTQIELAGSSKRMRSLRKQLDRAVFRRTAAPGTHSRGTRGSAAARSATEGVEGLQLRESEATELRHPTSIGWCWGGCPQFSCDARGCPSGPRQAAQLAAHRCGCSQDMRRRDAMPAQRRLWVCLGAACGLPIPARSVQRPLQQVAWQGIWAAPQRPRRKPGGAG